MRPKRQAPRHSRTASVALSALLTASSAVLGTGQGAAHAVGAAGPVGSVSSAMPSVAPSGVRAARALADGPGRPGGHGDPGSRDGHPSPAEPARSLSQAERAVDRLYREAAQAVRRYDTARRAALTQRGTVRRARTALAVKRYELAGLTGEIGATARAQYRDGGMSRLVRLLASETPDAVLRLGPVMREREQDVANTLGIAGRVRAELVVERRAADAALRELVRRTDRQAVEKRRIESRLAEAETRLAELVEVPGKSAGECGRGAVRAGKRAGAEARWRAERAAERNAERPRRRAAAAEGAAGRSESEPESGFESASGSNGESAPESAPGPHDAVAVDGARWVLPVEHYWLSAGYAGSGAHWAHRHTGQDFAVPSGTPVRAVGAGTVVSAGCDGAFGNQVVIRHRGGYFTQYAHLSALWVAAGQRVAGAKVIGLSGSTGNSTGPHLHFEARVTPAFGSAVDPVRWLREHGVTV
ncbi:peptidoglycan DD-metalloendopeptidase family protein [Streptomyces sp. H27-D2]|uniref:peptidoglycan DD-metalloendopeptidase family protein n=1 Tax=Streptomyces sp. H27-D2 TaxID=3046304 RepID=UPI002DB842DF|nr:peptidoglycan DD-metalloendopeptidase family protein [Streptomyces sp. H27-D2]MEC4020179.1 peptidoglycan DD-metalloendopeptidase family protein [Streptomyces sp. H27-D2]